ncbi:MAG: TIGR00730 family Rossman fold protein [Alphaproteobacteria bacterium]|nr:TIGR00730 family Rossman fold protein [Alphaproteobacteria bacterium]MCZ6587918.1 TIGR00730 family Rossman fold protein [Alphaproteobacteria bacterium]MCZ6590764.1 TIGR00730 family Rossman fold protein [Alphaproteobacteria bacterium]MCZ6847104.1 TIGR00730 family Rossman fold protein [Alphaproteobacteria bacterium]
MEHIHSLCVYCGSSDRGPAAHRQAARAFGLELAERGVRLIYGGGRTGVMGTLADAVLEGGSSVVGVIPDFLMRHEAGHEGVTQLEVVATMHERKARMAELSDGFVVLPGGLGTLDELFEIVTWKQLGLHTKPIVVVNSTGYWDDLRVMIDGIVATGYARPESAELAVFVSDINDVFPTLARLPAGELTVDSKLL